MKEQNGSEKNEKIEKSEKKKKRMSKEKRFYLITSISCAAALVAIVLIAVLVTNFGGVELPTAGNNSSINQPSNGGDAGNSGDVGDGGNDEPVINTPEGMIMPLESVSVVNDYGFYHNKTLNNYYEHKGVDFTAEVGTEVLAADDGVKTVYRFVDVAEGISVGTDVKKGDVIATVAEATGEEYKDGAHLHFEVMKSGQQVDPATYLTFEEK